MANKTNFFIICPASFKPLSVLFYFFIHPVVAVLCLCVHLCARILANIQIFNFTPKPMISSLHFHKSPKVCIIISLALVTGGYLCWGHSECRHSHEAERRGRKKKTHLDRQNRIKLTDCFLPSASSLLFRSTERCFLWPYLLSRLHLAGISNPSHT